MIDLRKLSRRVRVLRGEREWTQAQLAEAAGVERKTISQIELGKTSRVCQRTLRQLANAFGVDVEELMT